MIGGARKTIAKALGIDADKVRVLAPYVGGGFGGQDRGRARGDPRRDRGARSSGGRSRSRCPAARPRTWSITARDTVQRIRIGCDADGRDPRASRMRASSRRTTMASSSSRCRSARCRSTPASARRFTTDARRASTCPRRGAVRAPGEAVGTFAVECAMDELAEQLGIDPIELRRRNEPETDPTERQAVLHAADARLLRRGRRAVRLGRARCRRRGRCATANG